MDYRALWVVRHVMPDDRLAYGRVDTNGIGTITLGLRFGYIHHGLTWALSLYADALSGAGFFDLDLRRATDRPDVQVWFERVDERFTDGYPLQMYVGGRRPLFFEFLVRDDMVDSALISELNEDVLPDIVGLLSIKGVVDNHYGFG